ncbi:hypothetical protein BO70DRAFT_378336 [Aspergillus heteromorphus CBS 117.55]|uniref:GPI anchored protein n=1 Tax=Aspergillus heteromorphus CBS 117.55 TaxID=1448321 RepID=A0A317WRN0_9EURO|nr:uncharacterized protein BO70DRAFT_378336 [Aspergillus heteromorphus CBS 117.55]PWY87787.1 hypothetical protein BO70DRAFT_378336 [Aspergillus heteromorphus CBS 117.55]
MKGLQSGISMAMLAAVAKAQVIGGPSGKDIGNDVDIPFTSTFSSSVKEDHKDNHAVDVNKEKTVVDPPHGHHWKREEVKQTGDGDTGGTFYWPQTNEQSYSTNDEHNGDHHVDVNEDNVEVVKPPVHPYPHPHPHHIPRGGADVISGPGGIDTGNTADIPFTNKFSSSVDEKYKDDHSATIDKEKTIVDPKHHRWARHHGDVIGGPDGVDTGNTAAIPFTNDFSSSVDEKYKDDHSVDVNKDKTIVDPKHPWLHHWKKDHGDVIGGPDGIDTGNTADIPFTSTFTSSVDEKAKDDHSVDINKDKTIVDPKHPWRHHWKKEHGNVIGGPDGIDTGNTADIPFTSTFTSGVSEDYKDDHSVDLNKDKTVVDPAHPWRHHWVRGEGHDHDHLQGDVIGGPDGVDTGNTASIPFTNTFTSGVSEDYKDDHSVDVNKDKTVVDPAHPWRHHWVRGEGHDHDHLEGDVIGGPGGVDTGNTAAIPFTSTFTSGVSEDYKNDHSVDVNKDKTVVDPAHPWHHPWARGHGEDHFEGDVIGGPDGIDTGNSAIIPTTNSFSSSVNEDYKDDHSLDVNKDKTVVDPVHPWHHPWARGHGEDHFEGDVIGGPDGIDTGNSAIIPTTNSFSSSVKEDYKDNHGVDVNKDKTVVPGHLGPWHHIRGEPLHGKVIGGPSGIDTGNTADIPFTNTFSSSVAESAQDDHSIDDDFKGTLVRPHHFARRGGISGPSGIDTGNTADIPFTNTFTSTVDEAYKDDHSLDADVKDTVVRPPAHHHWKAREAPGHHEDHEVIGGPSGIDTGNTVDIPFTNTFSSSVDEAYKDDHSFDADVKDTLVHPGHHWKAREEPKHHEGVEVIGGPSGVDTGNTAAIPFTNTFSSSVDEAYKDDHSLDADVKDTLVHPGHHWKARKEPEHHEDHEVIGGPSGIDTGNTVDIPFTSTFSSDYTGSYTDDHSHTYNGHVIGHRRADDSLISGPSGVDTGNSAFIPFTNTFSQDTTESSTDDHSVTGNFDENVGGHHPHIDSRPHYTPRHRPRPGPAPPVHEAAEPPVPAPETHAPTPPSHQTHAPSPTPLEGPPAKPTHQAPAPPAPTHEAPVPPAPTHEAPAPPTHEAPAPAPTHEAPVPPAPTHEAPAPPTHEAPAPAPTHEAPVPPAPTHEAPAPPAPEEASNQDKVQEPAQTSSCSPTVHEVVRTLTHTLPVEPTESSEARPEMVDTPAHSTPAHVTEAATVSSNTPEKGHQKPTQTAAHSAPTHSTPVEGVDPVAHTTPVHSAPTEHPQSAVQSSPAHSAPSHVSEPSNPSSPFSSNLEQIHHVPGSEASSAAQPPQAVTSAASAPAPTEPVFMDSIASTITVQEASTLHMIPVYVPVPSATSQSDAAHSRILDMPSARPSGVDAFQTSMQYSAPSSTPAHGIMFTGAAAPMAPANGLFPIIAGVVALLAMIL